MDGLPSFSDPQPLAAAVALISLALALGLEALVLMLSLRRPPAVTSTPVNTPLPHDFYDWLYE
jgi:hypothetical protein